EGLSVYVGKTNAPIEERKTYMVRVGGEMSLKLAPGTYRLAAKLGSYSSPGRDISIVEPDPQTHFTTMLNGKYNVIGKQYEKVLKTCEGAEFLAREIKEAGYNTFMGMSYSLQRHNRKNTAIEQLVRERPSLGPWESYYQPSGRDRFMNAAVRNNLRFYENIFSHHDSMLPRHKAFLAAAERYASLELESMRHSPVFQGVCLYDEFYHSGGVHTAAIKDMFLKAQQMGFRERYDGLTVAEAKKALDRFVSRPPGRRRTEDVEKYRLWKEHEDWQWERFSRRMNGAIKDVMPSARTFALQRFGGGNGSNIAHNGPSERVFGPLDIASCVMYKDGGFGDRPVFAPMQADVLRIRKNIPVWTQLHCFHGPGIYGRHLLRQAFFALSQKVEGFSFFTIGFDPENPRQLDNRDTIRTIAAELCRPYGDFFMACEKGYKKVGIYYSRTAAHLRQRKSLKLSYACEGLWVGCMRAGYPADFLYDTDIIEGRGMEYDVVFAPGWELVGECPPSIQKALKRLVNAGKIVATERSSKLPVKGISRLQSSLDEYDDKLGGAFPRYVDFETEMVWNRSEKTTQLVGDFLSKHIEPAGLVQKAEGAEELPVHVGPDWLKCGRGQYMIIPNFAYTRFDGLYKTLYQAPDRPTVKFPEKNPKCYDMLEMRSVEVEREDDWMIVRPDFRYYPGKIYAFLPREIGGVSLKASPEVKAGETIQYQARVTDDAGRTINAGFPIEIKLEHPLGKTLYDVYRVAKPVYSGAYAMPVNITPGNWTLSVRELIGGAIAKTKIKVGRGALPVGQYDATTVFVHDGAQIRRFLKNNKDVIIARSESQQWLVPAARELSARLKKMGIQAEIKNIDGIVRTAGDWNRKNPTADGTRMWRGTVVAPGLFVDAPVIVLGRRYENRLVEALIGRGTVPEPLTENFPGQGRAVVGHVRRAFSNEYDTLYVLSRDETGIKRGIKKLLSPEADVSASVHPELVEPKVQTDAKLVKQVRQDWAPSSYRQNIWGEDLIRTIDVDPVSGRILVGTFGYGYNLF
ncbi:MAG: hypothetical protein KGZ25_13890, partial [Planctomycetes bacterium]|nr:hypothetical protein [Planctomycetota bacterium]